MDCDPARTSTDQPCASCFAQNLALNLAVFMVVLTLLSCGSVADLPPEVASNVRFRYLGTRDRACDLKEQNPGRDLLRWVRL